MPELTEDEQDFLASLSHHPQSLYEVESLRGPAFVTGSLAELARRGFVSLQEEQEVAVATLSAAGLEELVRSPHWAAFVDGTLGG